MKAITPKVGVFSVVIAVSVGALAFKGVDIAQTAFAVEAEDTPAVVPAEETALTAGLEEEAPPEEAPAAAAAAAAGAAAPPTPEQCLTTLNSAAEEMGLSSQEIVVLRSLQARRETLDAREGEIGTREAAAGAAEARLSEQIAELKALETQVQGLLAKMDEKSEGRMASLVKSYESMKPKDAAAIFNGMEDDLLTDIAKSMKPATLAAVLSSMQPKRAEMVTRLLANLAKPPANLTTPTSAPAAPAAPASPAAPPASPA
jgi:flagellar motility protein MotE (MotC chaperone)